MDSADFTTLFNNWYKPLCLFAYRYIKDPDVSEDLVQDVFVKLWHQQNLPSDEKDLKNYLFAAIKNKCFDHLEKNKKEQAYLGNENKFSTLPVIIDEEIENEILKLRIRKAIDGLPPKIKKVFLLHKIEGLSFLEIATHLGVSPKTVEKQVARAYELLRKLLS